MKKYKKRFADVAIKNAIETFGAVVIEGAKAVGKSTSAIHIAASSVSLDSSPELAALAQTSPGVVLAGQVPRLVDEWQLAPNLWNAVRHEADRRGSPGQFILTGSATPTDEITLHSGAGRFGRIRLRTMSLAETGHSTTQVNFRDLFSRGRKIGGLGGPEIPQIARLVVQGGWPLVKLGGEQFVNEGATNLKKLRDKLAEQRQRDLMSLNVVTAGNTSYSRDDGVNVIALGHLTVE